jgi:hypothetical protein
VAGKVITGTLRASTILRDAVDLHVHPAPSPYPRRITLAEAAAHAADAGMRAIVAKSHHHSTASDAAAVRSSSPVDGVEVFGGIVLNSHVGGFNADAVNVALALGARIVWLPTISSPLHIEHAAHIAFPSTSVPMRPDRPVDVWARNGGLRRDVKAVLREVAAANAILASGHLSPPSILATFEQARALGVRRLLVNHPNFIVNATRTEVRRLVELGAYVEHASCHYDDRSKYRCFPPETLVKWIRAVGPERSVIASDLGQAGNPLPAESLVKVARALHRTGMTARETRMMLVDNPSTLLGLS